MRLPVPFGFVVSLLLHAGLLTWALIGFSTAKPLKMPDEVPVEVSIISQLDLELKQKKGDSLSKLEEAAQSDGKQPTPKDAPKPKPVRAVEPPPPAAAAEPPPPPPEPVKAPEPPPPPPPKAPDQIAALIEKAPAPAPPPVADGPTPEEKKKLEDKIAEQQRQDEAKAKAEAEARAQAEADAKARAEAERKAAEKKKADDLKKKLADDKKKKEEAEKKKAAEIAKKAKAFDAQKVADLLNKIPEQPSAAQGADTPPVKPTSAKGPTAGTKTGTDNVNKAKAEQMLGAMLNAAFKECWSKPSAGGGVSAPAVKLKWSLNQDGTLNGEPKVIQSDRNSPLADQAERAAIRAVQTCVPFQLPAEHYNLWRVIDWNFNPNQQ